MSRFPPSKSELKDPPIQVSMPGMNTHRPALCCQLALVLATFVMSALPGNAQNPVNRNTQPLPFTKKGKAAELPVITSVTASSVTVDGRTYEVSESTSVTVNGKKATLVDLKAGMQVSVAGSPKTFGKTRNDTVFKATRIIARTDNQLAAKAEEFNKNAEERARQAAQNARNNNR